jgi:hypothetical protein
MHVNFEFCVVSQEAFTSFIVKAGVMVSVWVKS